MEINNIRPEENYIRNLSDEAQKAWVVNIIDRMCEAYGLDGKGIKDQLAERLGIKASTIKGWVFNRRIPFHAMVTCYRDTGTNLIWLLDGSTPDFEITADSEKSIKEKVVEHLFNAQRYALINTPDGVEMVGNMIVEDLKEILGVSTARDVEQKRVG